MTGASLRVDVLTGRQVLIAPHRSQRPGAESVDPVLVLPPNGNPFLQGCEDQTPDERLALRRTDSRPNESGWLVRVVPNQFPAVFTDKQTPTAGNDGLLSRIPVSGVHEVVVESPMPRRRLSELTAAETARVLLAWQHRVRDLEQQSGIEAITVFRNEGFNAGASLPHVHSQILTLNTTPPQTASRLNRSGRHRSHFRHSLLHDLCEAEVADGTRIVAADSSCLVICPYAGRVSWQVRIVPRQSVFDSFSSCSGAELNSIAGNLHAAVTAIDECAGRMAMSILLVQPPVSNQTDGWFLNLMPRSTRTAGYELATDIDIVTVAPESAAKLLRKKSKT